MRNRADALPAQLDALVIALADRADTEVIVADNGSTDATVVVVERYRDRLPVRVVDASREAGINVARNEGVKQAAGRRIVLCDADDSVAPAWLEQMSAAFDSGCELLVGTIDYVLLNSEEERRWRGAERASILTPFGFLPSGHGANLGFTRGVWERIGGFDESFLGGGGDTDFCWRAQLAGFEIHEAPLAVVHYRLRNTLWGLWLQAVNYGRSEVLLFRQHQEHGLRRRPADLARELLWLATRLSFVLPRGRRGAWVRKAGQQWGRLLGSLRLRTLWW